MNYIIEDNINFFSELEKELSKKETNSKENICLITREQLESNYITLACNHKFNYLPLYKEICNQKLDNYLEVTHLSINQIKCPYCRQITNKLLPFIKHKDVEYKKGINYPLKYCMKLHSCQWIIKSGKNRNNTCNKCAFVTEHGIYCNLHEKLCKKKKIHKEKETAIEILWSAHHEEINKKLNMIQLKQFMRENKLKIGGTKKELVDRIINKNFKDKILDELSQKNLSIISSKILPKSSDIPVDMAK
jgi:hypothetical protein